jgi:hypothetical protein
MTTEACEMLQTAFKEEALGHTQHGLHGSKEEK